MRELHDVMWSNTRVCIAHARRADTHSYARARQTRVYTRFYQTVRNYGVLNFKCATDTVKKIGTKIESYASCCISIVTRKRSEHNVLTCLQHQSPKLTGITPLSVSLNPPPYPIIAFEKKRTSSLSVWSVCCVRPDTLRTSAVFRKLLRER